VNGIRACEQRARALLGDAKCGDVQVPRTVAAVGSLLRRALLVEARLAPTISDACSRKQ
jgi:hypothetical protein